MNCEIKFYKPFIPENFHYYAKNIASSGILTQGRYLEAFEEELKSITGAKYCLCVSSGTSALHIVASIIKDKKAFISSYGFPAAFNAFLLAGKDVVPVDCSLDDYNIDISQLYAKVGYDEGAIVVIHQFGYPCHIPPPSSLIIEDAACAMFTEVNGQHLGTIGDIGILSFHPRKIITTGEGGAILFKDEELYLKAKAFRSHGITSPGLNYRMPELSAALGLCQLGMKNYIYEQRVSAYNKYVDRLQNTAGITLPKYTEVFCPQSFVIRLNSVFNVGDREVILNKLKVKGVDCRFASKSVLDVPYVGCGSMRNTEILSAQCISLPFYTEIQDDDIDYVCETLREVYNDIR